MSELVISDQDKQYIASLIEKARIAQKIAASWDQERIDEVCVAAGWAVYNDENIRKLARAAVDETGMGVYEDKIAKHKNKVMGVLRDIQGAKTVGLIEVDDQKGIYKYAKPVGVVGSLTPVTNPTATPASNGLSILKGRNAVIFAPHPRSKKATGMACTFMRQALQKVNAPEDLIQYIPEPSLELTTELMHQVDLIVATGGGPMVKAAYSSGTPAYGVGPGNAVQLLCEDADVGDAAEKILTSKCFDNATSCSSENSVVVHQSLYSRFQEELQKRGAYICSPVEKARLKEWLWITGKKGKPGLNPAIIAQSAGKIASEAGISVTQGTRALVVEGTLPIQEDIFFQEKISPVLTILPCADFVDGLNRVEEITDFYGTGHSAGIFTHNREYIHRMGMRLRTSRIMVRQPMASGNGGTFFNGMPSTVTLGCGTWGGNITTENIHWKHFINVTWLSLPLEPHRPLDEEIFSDYWKKYGR
ncbi:MAG: aldehyde dehydrogenase family protein [Spirochaetales bacterium]|nr:aldehyde dehydrogenase family protein [Spirochaetales bacterium]